jgi:hypothetical protein
VPHRIAVNGCGDQSSLPRSSPNRAIDGPVITICAVHDTIDEAASKSFNDIDDARIALEVRIRSPRGLVNVRPRSVRRPHFDDS